jgi:hypothetical protein
MPALAGESRQMPEESWFVPKGSQLNPGSSFIFIPLIGFIPVSVLFLC